MKIIKLAIGVVIAVIVVGIMATSVHSMTQETVKNKVVTFTINVTEETYSPNVYNEIIEFGLAGDTDSFTNVIEAKINDIIYNDLQVGSYGTAFTIYSHVLDGQDVFINNGSYSISDGIFQDGDVVTLTFEVTQAPRLTGVIAILLLLAPLIFTGGVLAFMLNKQEF